MPGSRNLR
uniref:Uncharacterized protein n=1 Tax=Oryza rufipogon TaxID=4529 RepID=A0A0G2KBQ7_ORYRU